VRLYHVRDHDRGGALDARDEEECYSSAGRAIGVWLTTEASARPTAYSAEVDPAAVEAFEVSSPDDSYRAFVVPGALVATLGFASV
jgi:hypothetical protein